MAASEGFLYDRIAAHIERLIASGALPNGSRAPSLRALGRDLGVSINTVQLAYDKLERLGRLEARPQSGFFVRAAVGTDAPRVPRALRNASASRVVFGRHMNEIIAAAARDDVLPLSIASPHADLLPTRALARMVRRIAAHAPAELVNYAPIAGVASLRQRIAKRLSRPSRPVNADDVLITTGATEALALSLRALTRPGDTVAVESPTYFSLLQAIDSLGLLTLEIPTDADTGLTPAALETALDSHDVRAVVSVGNFNNPTGSLVPEPAKRDIVSLLAARRIPLIEDDVYGDLHFGPERPATYKRFDDTGLVFSCGGFSKTVAPGWRVGWLHATDRHERLRDLKLIASSASPAIEQLAMSEFLAHGFERQLARLRAACETQVAQSRHAIVRHFPVGTRLSTPQGGYTIWVECPRGVDSHDIYREALAAGISIAPGPLFSGRGAYKRFLRICAGLPFSPSVEAGIEAVGRLVARAAGRTS